MANLRLFLQRLSGKAIGPAYLLTVVGFLWMCAQFHLPGKGFTYLVMFGDKENARFIPELKAVNHYELQSSAGYDGAYYAQLAMQPHLSSPSLKVAVDNLAYRARRMLFSWTAHGLALGNPERALQIFSVQNIVCWVLLAALLLRWFPATSWENFLRWFAVLCCYGLFFSVRGSLVDGPSLLLIASGLALLESGRPWWAAAVLGVAGLGKETNVLGGAALARPAAPTPRAWLQVALRGAVVVLPILVWIAVLRTWLGPSDDLGIRNFTWPLVEYGRKWLDTISDLVADGWDSFAFSSLLMLIALTVQFLFFAFRRDWTNPWWRVAAVYSVMMIFLGEAVWEGYPGAASRVLLPMTLAFNVLLPRGRRWWLVFLLGNATVFASWDLMKAPGRESYVVEGDTRLQFVAATGRSVEVVFDEKWYPPERSRLEFWRWCSGASTVTLRNPHPFPILVNVSFGIRAKDARKVGLWEAGQARWERLLAPGERREVRVHEMRLETGDTVWRFETNSPGKYPDSDDRRRLAFSLRDLTIEIVGRADRPAKP